MDIQAAQRNVNALKIIAKAKDFESFNDCLTSLSGMRMRNIEDDSIHDDLCEQFTDPIDIEYRRLEAIELQEKSKEYINDLRENYLILSYQRWKTDFYLDVPFYIIMSRLDELNRKTFSGRRFNSYFSPRNELQWVDPAKISCLGLADLEDRI